MGIAWDLAKRSTQNTSIYQLIGGSTIKFGPSNNNPSLQTGDTLPLRFELDSFGFLSKMSVPDKTFGYGRLAKTLALDHDLSMFRRFAALNIRNILYLQSELQSLELKLHDIDNDANDISKGNAIWGQPRSWYWAKRSQVFPVSGEQTEGYWDIVLQIRDLLEKYSMLVNRLFPPGVLQRSEISDSNSIISFI